MKFSPADSRVKMWRFTDVSWANSILHLQVVLVVWEHQNWWVSHDWVISFGSTKPPAHPDEGDGVTSRNVRKPHLDAAVCPRIFHCRLTGLHNAQSVVFAGAALCVFCCNTVAVCLSVSHSIYLQQNREKEYPWCVLRFWRRILTIFTLLYVTDIGTILRNFKIDLLLQFYFHF